MLSNYAGRFPVEYTRDLLPLFISALKWYAEKNIGRQYYERIAGILGKIRRLEGGGKVVEELVAKFRDKYSRRRAMMEVLKDQVPRHYPRCCRKKETVN